MTSRTQSARHVLCALVLALVFGANPLRAQTAQDIREGSPQVRSMRSYIRDAWTTLTRSMTDCSSLADPKVHERAVLYVANDISIPSNVEALQTKCGITVKRLPVVLHSIGQLDPRALSQPGLLYLPNPYVVPGGRFNEMYGWDSYFIMRGLLRDDQDELARGMIENFFYEIEHYGGVLNANRTYYLTRSQPPFLTSMVMSYYDKQKQAGHADLKWLANAYTYSTKEYQLWTHDPHLAGTTGLARYYDFGEGPVPEMGDDPTYYIDTGSDLLVHPPENTYTTTDTHAATIGPVFSYKVCGAGVGSAAEHCGDTFKFSLTQAYYKGDRSMRESGFDVSFRFGAYGGSTQDFAPVCLNSLLYQAESDLETMAHALGKDAEAKQWHERAAQRQAAMQKYFWNPRRGLFFDYDFAHSRMSSYDFAATFYPLWAGWATREQAEAVRRNLHVFERAGGIATSDRVTGVQWDMPYGWAPLQLMAVEGLRRYGFNDDADRISGEWIGTVLQNFEREHTIREKYNVITRTSDAQVSAGYKQNVVGFGWTNAVTSVLLHELGSGAELH